MSFDSSSAVLVAQKAVIASKADQTQVPESVPSVESLSTQQTTVELAVSHNCNPGTVEARDESLYDPSFADAVLSA